MCRVSWRQYARWCAQFRHSTGDLGRVSCRAFRPPPMPALLHPPIPHSKSRQRWHQLYGSARSLALAEAIESDTRPYLAIARDARELDQLRAELAFFLGGSRPIHVLPDWEVLPYDIFSP